MDLTLAEIKQKRIELEAELRELVLGFQRQTKIEIEKVVITKDLGNIKTDVNIKNPFN